MKKIIFLTLCMLVTASICYAQDQIQWGDAGVPIAYENDVQYFQKNVVNSYGDIFVGWCDNRSGNADQLEYEDDIYMQKLDRNGFKYWPEAGLPIVVKPGRQYQWDMIRDANDTIILAWTDYDPQSGEKNIYAQRVYSNGTLLWGDEGILVNGGGEEFFPVLATDDRGGAYIFWGRGDFTSVKSIRAQHISAEGDLLWAGDGIQISNPDRNARMIPQIVPDANGGVICLLEYSGSDDYLVVQRLNSDGIKLWGEYGVDVVVNDYESSQYAMTEHNESGAIVCWSYGNRAMAQRINASGSLMWGGGKQLLPSPVGGSYTTGGIKVVNGGAGNFHLGIAYRSHYSGIPSLLVVQKFSPNGDLLWGEDGIRIAEISLFYGFDICSDYYDGMYVIWIDGDTTPSTMRPYAQHLNSLGEELWNGGVALIDEMYASYNTAPSITRHIEQGGAVVLWEDSRSGNYLSRDIYGQMVYQNQKPFVVDVNITPLFANEGDTVSFIGQGDDYDGQIISYEWRSSIDGFLSNEAQFYKNDLSSGQHEIYFKVQDSVYEWSEEALNNLDINALPNAFIDSIAPNPAKEGEVVTLTGHGEDQNGEIVEYGWRSSIDGYLGNNSTLLISTLSVGIHTIFFKAKDNDSAWSEETSQQLIVEPIAEKGAIYGKVLGRNQSSHRKPIWIPLYNATVEVIGKNTGITKTVQTDLNGNYRIDSLPQDRYRVTASKETYTPKTIERFLKKDSEKRIDFKLFHK